MDAAPPGSPADQVASLLAALRPHVPDERVLAALAAVPRQCFVPPERQAHAWVNAPLPIGSGQTISQPLVVARMCALLDVRPGARVLDVGTGSGYHAALLAVLGGHVTGVERHPELAELARQNLAVAGIDGVEVLAGDGRAGHAAGAPYDAINVAAAAWREVPAALERQLAAGGRMVVPVARRGQRLILVRRGPQGLERTVLDAVRFVPLI